MPGAPPKPIVTSWDVFDTLVARFAPNPQAVFHAVEENLNVSGFVSRRMDAQMALDRIGTPYVLHDIYRQMVKDGLAPSQARQFIQAEIAVEHEALFPIRRNVERVDSSDLIISDMYLPPEVISGFLFQACDLHLHRPIIRSNWGKHTGTIWPLVLDAYVIRKHVGDNPNADQKIPGTFRINCELVQDSAFSAWERVLQQAGLEPLALIQREVRLRSIPPDATAFHHAVVGPYFTILVCFAIQLLHHFGRDAEFAFLSRSSDELARVFIGMFPDVTARSLDISRRLVIDRRLDRLFATGINAGTVVVDMVGSGRSYFSFSEQNGRPERAFILFAFLEFLLEGPDRTAADQRQAEGRLHHVLRLSGGGLAHWPFEHLLQSHYPPVSGVAADPASGGVVRTFGAPELDQAEARLISWKSQAVTALVRAIRRRDLDDPGEAAVSAILLRAMQTICEDAAIMAPFSSFRAREAMDWT
jgi:hypothetical protein